MSRYLVKKAINLQPLQEGDYPQPLAFIVPDVLDMSGKEAIFVAEYDDHTELFTKQSALGEITVDGQSIIVNLLENDTKDKAGVYHWYLKVTDNDELITIGYGKIQINKLT